MLLLLLKIFYVIHYCHSHLHLYTIIYFQSILNGKIIGNNFVTLNTFQLCSTTSGSQSPNI